MHNVKLFIEKERGYQIGDIFVNSNDEVYMLGVIEIKRNFHYFAINLRLGSSWTGSFLDINSAVKGLKYIGRNFDIQLKET